MYNHYYVNTNAQSNGDHEVHREDCSFLPAPGSRLYLGLFEECFSAVAKARAYFRQVNGCYYCCRPCHTS